MEVSTRLKRVLATLLLVAAFARAGVSLRIGGTSQLASMVAVLYVGSIVFLGVWTERLNTVPYTRAALLGLVALIAALYEPTAILAPILVLPGVIIVVRDLREQRGS
jgi:hypothetical protein